MGWVLVGALAAVLTTLAFVPQILKMWRTRSVRDISPVTLLQLLTGVALWTIYGAHLRDPVIIAANGVATVILAAALVLYLRFFRRRLQ